MRIGERIELGPACGLRARGETGGEIVAVVERHGRVTVLRVRLDSGRVVTIDPAKVEAV